MADAAVPPGFRGEIPDMEVHALFDNPRAYALGFHLTEYLWYDMLTDAAASTYLLVTDTNVAKLFLADHQAAFKQCVADTGLRSKAGEPPRLLVYMLLPGETNRTRETKAGVEDYMVSEACTRDTCIVALGGGVVGQLAGYVAATFMRGIPMYYIPTTLIAMVDSSIGGKTSVNLPRGMGVIGAIWHPRRVYSDLAVLTLPARDVSAGMAEVIKCGAVASLELFEWLEASASEIRRAVVSVSLLSKQANQDPAIRVKHIGRTKATRTAEQSIVLHAISRAARGKLDIVRLDMRDRGPRELLYFGHVIGRAIEMQLAHTLMHGECVAIGMVLEAEVARSLGHLDQASLDRMMRCLRAYDLPVSLTDTRIRALVAGRPCHGGDMIRMMKADNKSIGSTKCIALLDRIGGTVEQHASPIPDHVIERVLCEAVQVLPDRLPGFADALEVPVPGSRAITCRALVLAALGTGTCRIRNLLYSNDTYVVLLGLEKLEACTLAWDDDSATLAVTGGGGSLHVPAAEFDVGTAVSTVVCLLITMSLLAHPQPDRPSVTLTEQVRADRRPVATLVEALVENGNNISFLGKEGHLPLRVGQGFHGGYIRVPTTMLSQDVASVLLCAPYAEHEVTLEVVGEGQTAAQSYIDMTITMMRSFGIAVERVAVNTYRVPLGCYVCPPEYVVEPDASSATYPLAIAAITGTAVTVPSLGSASIQGDAGFATEVLRPMGCKVVQTETSTTVRGCAPGTLRPLPLINMERLACASMTTAVLAAVATGQDGSEDSASRVTRIVGIASQRVKDCDRIRAMVDELTRFGVHAVELPDGLEITGAKLATLKAPWRGVCCYNDHRIAMSFSVLGCVVPDVLIQEKRCVEETWPQYWDMLENVLGFRNVGVDLKRSKWQRQRRDPDTTAPSDFSQVIILVGTHKVGKTTLGRTAANTLGMHFVDLDLLVENTEGRSCANIIAKYSWPHFRDVELRCLRSCLDTCQPRTIIATGSGIVEMAEARQSLKDFRARGGAIVFIRRDADIAKSMLAANASRPAYPDSVGDVYARREPFYRSLSSHEFYNIMPSADGESTSLEQESASWITACNLFNRFVRFLLADDTNQLSAERLRNSFSMRLAVEDVRSVLGILPRILDGIDAVELRVDHLANLWQGKRIDYNRVHRQLMVLRQATPLPVIFTVRTQDQGGQFPNDRVDEMFVLLEKAIRWGCEYVDVEVVWDSYREDTLAMMRGNTQLIASWHGLSGKTRWDSLELREIYDYAAGLGNIVRLVNTARNLEDNMLMHQFLKQLPADPPVAAFNMGVAGQSSRLLNRCLNPVTHAALPTPAAPGQLTMAKVHRGRHLVGVLPSRTLYLFGTPISHSLFPLLHNTGFRELGLPHHYQLHETSSVDAVGDMIHGPDFGGASVASPHGRAVIPLMDELTARARALGAVDTIILATETPEEGAPRTKLVGDNTAWRAMVRRIQEVRASQQSHSMAESALVLGAGETARAALYALQHLNVPKIYLVNRTTARAHGLVRSLQIGSRVRVLTTTDLKLNQVLKTLSIIISTVPPHALTIASTRKHSSSTVLSSTISQQTDALHMPEEILSWRGRHSSGTMVVMDWGQAPRRTALIRKARTHGWNTVDGVSLVLAQGFEQFQLWTGRRAPTLAITEAVSAKDRSVASAP